MEIIKNKPNGGTIFKGEPEVLFTKNSDGTTEAVLLSDKAKIAKMKESTAYTQVGFMDIEDRLKSYAKKEYDERQLAITEPKEEAKIVSVDAEVKVEHGPEPKKDMPKFATLKKSDIPKKRGRAKGE